jgi:hypothetical protein
MSPQAFIIRFELEAPPTVVRDWHETYLRIMAGRRDCLPARRGEGLRAP